MAYQIRCLKCPADTWAGNIRDLIDGHTTETGRLRCGHCGETETYVAQITGRWEQEPDATWDEYIKGVIRLTPDARGITPVVFLTAAVPDGEVAQLRVSYYTAPDPDGRLTPGPGPGTAPTLTLDTLRQLLVKLGAFGVVRPQELEVVAQLIRLDAPMLDTHAVTAVRAPSKA